MNNEIIQIGDKSYIKSSVIMLPTEKVTSLWLNKDNNQVFLNTYLSINNSCQPQYLYFTTDEEIKEGDWMIRDFDRTIIQDNINSDNRKGEKFKKIVATTDVSFQLVDKNGKYIVYSQLLPRPSNSFIEAYVKAQGKIKDVLIEVEIVCKNEHHMCYITTCVYPHCDKMNFIRVKVAPDNTISIKATKDNWNREEVKQLIKQYELEKTDGSKRTTIFFNIDEWIEQNL
jgi:hypothetical protein